MRLILNFAGCLLLFSVPAFGQTASLAGKIVASAVPADPGGVVPGVSIRLELEQDSSRNTSTESDANGNWSLTNLLPGEYTLTASSRWFVTLTVRGIKIVGGERKVLPALRLDIGSSGCGGGPRVQYAQLLDGETRTGDFGARIQLYEGPMKGEPQSIAGAEVWAICGWDVICGTTTTNQDGEFRLTGLKPGKFKLQVTRKGFYPLTEGGYRVDAGRESIYYPIYLEKCFRGDCNPSNRPKKPLIVCE